MAKTLLPPFTVQSLLPEYLSGIPADRIEDVLFLGSHNIRQIVRVERRNEEIFDRRITTEAGELFEQLLVKKAEVAWKVRLLLLLEERAEPKPVFPCHRQADWFRVGDPLICFMSDEWVPRRARVGANYPTGSNHIPLDVINAPYRSVEMPEIRNPRFMLEADFHYLRANPDYVRVWIATVERDLFSNFGRNRMLAALMSNSEPLNY